MTRLSTQKAPAHAWLSGNIDEEADIIKDSLDLASYDIVLSLLWIHDEIRPAFRRYGNDNE